jgi:multiple sugar transport system permease protein
MATAAPPIAAAPLVQRRPPASIRRRRFLVAVADHSVLIALSIMFLAPFAFIFFTAVMSDQQALSAKIWPHPFVWHNFVQVWSSAPLFRYYANTIFYAGLATLGVLVSSVPVAYALARLRWRGRNAVLLLVLASMMLPQQVTVVPLYVMFAKIHLVGTLWPLILPNFVGDAFSIFLLRQFFLTIPEEYADAARVDGCGELRIMVSVIARLAKPALAAVALFSFLYCWNDFFGPLLYTGENEGHWTLSVGLSQFRTVHQVQWNLTMAATLLFMAPVIALFFAAQKAFVEGVTLTGVKG